MLRAVLEFVQRARKLEGIHRIALLGSLATDKPHPKDVDLLVVIEESVPLGPLAKLKRQMEGKVLQTGESRGAEVFLASPDGHYLGRICHWKECRPGIRQSCEAQHCGRQEFLYDDLQNIHLDSALIAQPPLELWPHPGSCAVGMKMPQDVRDRLVTVLTAEPG